MLERQRITRTESVDLDVVALARAGDLADVQLLFIRGGMLVGRQDFLLKEVGERAEGEILTGFLEQFYNKDVLLPPEIALSGEAQEPELLEQWLGERRGARVRLLTPQRGKTHAAVKLALENAQLALQEHLRRRAEGGAAARELQRLLGLKQTPRRIEAFDISNIQGDQATGSMVVWADDRAKKADYRHFKIKTIEGANDFGSMHEVVKRRYRIGAAPSRSEPDPAAAEGPRSNSKADKTLPLPDLIVIDGGRGQLSAALEALRDLGITGPDVIGLAKERRGAGGDPGAHRGGAHAQTVHPVAWEGPRSNIKKFERVFLPGASEPVALAPNSPATHLLQRVRDEAHRFAITYHRKLRAKELVLSELNEIAGIGPGRKRALLRAFRSMERIRAASVDELAAVRGISRALASAIAARLKTG